MVLMKIYQTRPYITIIVNHILQINFFGCKYFNIIILSTEVYLINVNKQLFCTKHISIIMLFSELLINSPGYSDVNDYGQTRTGTGRFEMKSWHSIVPSFFLLFRRSIFNYRPEIIFDLFTAIL